MGELQDQVQLQILVGESEAKNFKNFTGQAAEPEKPAEHMTAQPKFRPLTNYLWWLKISIYVLSILAGQTAATILGRLYFDKGGNSKWMSTLVQVCGFPIILVFYIISPLKNSTINPNYPSNLTLSVVYLIFGIFLAANCLLYSLGLLYLPVSTYTLICASQLGFNALFSLFINSQKFTPFIINSVVLLTISSTLLVFQKDSTESKQIPKGKYVLGFICTVGASAGYGLMLSTIQYCFTRILKQETFKVVLDMIFYPAIVATLVVLIGLFGSGEWKGLKEEMEGYSLGNVGYLMTLIWIAISWQVYSIGCVGLIFEVSALFSNIIGTLGLPIVPALAVFVFHDDMNGLKVISMLMAIWGFISYGYQHYIDDYKSESSESSAIEVVSEGLKKVEEG